MDLNILLTGAVTASTSVEVRTGTNIRSVASLVIIEYAHQEEVHGARGYLYFIMVIALLRAVFDIMSEGEGRVYLCV